MKNHPIRETCVRTLIAALLAGVLPAGFATAGPAAAPALAQAGSVTAELSAWRVVAPAVAAPGKTAEESFERADTARPGDLIEYRARYRNDGPTAVRSLAPIVPIPAGMVYVPATARPRSVFATTGESGGESGGAAASFSSVPLRRKVRQADGSEVLRDVAPVEYRALRWMIGTLQPGQEVVVSLRARVAATPGSAAARASTAPPKSAAPATR